MSTFSIHFDYRFDSTGFFDDPDPRSALEEAASIWESIIFDEFDDVQTGIEFEIVDPSDGITTRLITVENAIDDITIFVGARDLGESTLALAGPSGFSAEGDIFTARISSDFRGNGPVTDFEPWVGTLSFDTGTNWNFSIDEVSQSDFDFISVALHEIGHVLGLTTSATFENFVSHDEFFGVNSIALFDGDPVPLVSNTDFHVLEGFLDDSVLMDPTIAAGIRRLPSDLDKAMLADIGYIIDDYIKQGEKPQINTDSDETIFGTVVADAIYGGGGHDQIQGNQGDDTLWGEDGNDVIFGESGNDYLAGGDGSDQLIGGEGNDELNGCEGYDELWGGTGIDKFIFEIGNGTDVINDFNFSDEIICFDPGLFETEEDAIAAIIHPFSNVFRWDFGNGDILDVFHEGGEAFTAKNIDLVSEHNSNPIGFSISVIGDATEEMQLSATASVASDADGLPEPLAFSYQWQSSSNGVDWMDIDGATSAEFTPNDAEVGLQLRVVASYIDIEGTEERVISVATPAVENVNDAPTVTSEAILSATESNFYTYTFAASDVDGDAITLTAVQKPDWLDFTVSDTISITHNGNFTLDGGIVGTTSKTAILSGTPTQNDVGTSEIILRATDAAGAYAEQSFALFVENLTPEGLLWDTSRSRAHLKDDQLTIGLISDYSPTDDDLFGSATSIPNHAILDLRNKYLSISDIPLVTPAVIPQMYVFVSENIVNLTDQKDLSINVAYNEPVTDHQLVLTVDGAVVEFTSDEIEYTEDPLLHPVEDVTTHFNITMTSDFIDNLFSNSANTIELGYEDSTLVRLLKLDADNYIITKTYTGDYSQTISAQTFKDAQYTAVTYTGDAWTASVVIGADDADTIKLSNQNTAVFTGSGNDTIIFDRNGAFGSGLAALNISSSLQTGTEELINLNGKTRFEDVMNGGADFDTVELTDASDAFFLHDSLSGFHSSLTLSNDYEGHAGTARIENIENINAGGGDDIVDLTSPDYSLAGQNITVNGGEGHDTLWGSDADEFLNGDDGDDILFGGAGTNTLTGGLGADEFQFTKTSMNDTITDFNITEGDSLAFFNTGGAEFDKSSGVFENGALTIAFGPNTNDQLTIYLGNDDLMLSDISNAIILV